MSSAEKIKKLFAKSGLTVNSKVDDRIISNALTALEKSEKTKSVSAEPNIWRIIMRSRITKLAAAMVIVVVVLIGMHYFGGGSIDMTSVAWGNVLEYVEQVSTVVFRITVINTVPGKDEPVEVQAVVYVSSEYGTRRDMYIDNKIVSTSHTVPKENIVITVIPEEKKFFRMIIPQDKFRQRQTNEDPREMIKQFISTEYEQLSPDQINGIDVEGIEVKGPRVMGGMFENATARLWVDVQTDLPVLMEIGGVAGGGSIQMKMVIDDFQWDVELEPSLFEPNIPADYTSKKIDIPDVNEGRQFAACSSLPNLQMAVIRAAWP
jgi:hypothetical protein